MTGPAWWTPPTKAEPERPMTERPFEANRYRRITVAMVDPDKDRGRHQVITLVRKVHRYRDLSHFFDNATDADLRLVEEHLGL